MRFIPIVSNSQNTVNICYDQGSKSHFIPKIFIFSSESDYATGKVLVLTFLPMT